MRRKTSQIEYDEFMPGGMQLGKEKIRSTDYNYGRSVENLLIPDLAAYYWARKRPDAQVGDPGRRKFRYSLVGGPFSDRDISSVEKEINWYAKDIPKFNKAERDHIKKQAGAVVIEDPSGYVSVEWYKSKPKLKSRWEEIESGYLKDDIGQNFGTRTLPELIEELRESMKSMTYGVLPSWREFEKAFKKEVPEGQYPMTLRGEDSKAARGTVLGDGTFDAKELYKGVKQLTAKYERGDDDAGSLASAILDTLGFEWV